MRRRRGLHAVIGLMIAALALAGCGGSGSKSGTGTSGSVSGSGGQGSAGTTGSAGQTPSPTPTSLSAADYKQKLVAVNTDLAADFGALRNAHSADDVKTALGKLSHDASSDASTLPDDPPPAAVAANKALSQALSNLGVAADDTKSGVGSKVCTPGAATALFTRSDGAGALRDAAKQLAAADLSFDNTVAVFLPAPIADQTRRLANGKVLRRSSGPGSLTIKSADVDAVVTLTPNGSKTPAASIYVQSNSETTLSGVPGETFQAYVSSGTDWDAAGQKFTRNCAFGLADSTFDFSGSDWTLTLTKQVGGNLDLKDLGPDDAPGP